MTGDRGISVETLNKDYRVHRRQAGLWNTVRSIFHRPYETIHGRRDLISIAPGERVNFSVPTALAKRRP
jgi:ABC-type uncharacterized transport system ATPase subunit